MSVTDQPPRRATLISGTASPLSSVTALLRQSAALSIGTIAGIFVEDRALLRAAALPTTREIGRVSGILQSLDLSSVETTLRRQADRLRTEIGDIAATLQRPWSFDIAHGDIAAEALGQAAAAQVAVLLSASRPMTSELEFPGRNTPDGAIVVLTDRHVDDRPLDVAVALANAQQRRLVVYLHHASLPAAARLRRRLADALTAPLDVSNYEGSAAGLAKTLLHRTGQALVLPAATMTSAPEAFETALRQLGLSILLID